MGFRCAGCEKNKATGKFVPWFISWKAYMSKKEQNTVETIKICMQCFKRLNKVKPLKSQTRALELLGG